MRLKKPINNQGLELINLMKRGLSNKELAVEMGVAEKTIKHYCYEIYKRLGIHSDRELFALIINLRPTSSDRIIQFRDINGYFNLTINMHSLLK